MQGTSADEMVESVLLASRALVAVAARSLAAAPADVTLAQFRVLVVLSGQGSQPASALAADLGSAPSSLTRMTDRLVRKGLVERQADGEDRRQVLVVITPEGQAVVDAVNQARRREIGRLLRAVPTDRRPLVAEALTELAAAAGELPADAAPLGWTR